MIDELLTSAAHAHQAGSWATYPLLVLAIVGAIAAVALAFLAYVAQPRDAGLYGMGLLVLAVLTIGLGLTERALAKDWIREIDGGRGNIQVVGGAPRACVALGFYAAIGPLSAAGLLLGYAFGKPRSVTSALAGPALAIGLAAFCTGAAVHQGTLAAAEERAKIGWALEEYRITTGCSGVDPVLGHVPPPAPAEERAAAATWMWRGALVGCPFLLAGILLLAAMRRERAQP